MRIADMKKNAGTGMYYQPLIAHDGELKARISDSRNHPDRGLVPPDEFIPLADRIGLIGEIEY